MSSIPNGVQNKREAKGAVEGNARLVIQSLSRRRRWTVELSVRPAPFVEIKLETVADNE